MAILWNVSNEDQVHSGIRNMNQRDAIPRNKECLMILQENPAKGVQGFYIREGRQDRDEIIRSMIYEQIVSTLILPSPSHNPFSVA